MIEECSITQVESTKINPFTDDIFLDLFNSNRWFRNRIIDIDRGKEGIGTVRIGTSYKVHDNYYDLFHGIVSHELINYIYSNVTRIELSVEDDDYLCLYVTTDHEDLT